MREARSTFLRSGAAPLLMGFALLTLVVGATFWFLAAERQSSEAAARAVEVEGRLYRLLSNLQDIETGQRGFLLTREDSYLAPWLTAIDTFEEDFTALGPLLSDSPSQAQSLTALRTVAERRIGIARTTIDLGRAGRIDDAIAMVKTGEGKAMMDRAREVVGQMLAEEKAILSAHQEAIVIAGERLRLAFLVFVVLFAALMIFALSNSYRQMRGLVASRDALRAVNAELVDAAARRERLEEQLRQSQKMEAIGQITGGLAHDFNNMLAVIIGSLNLLKRRIERGDKDFLRFIDSAMDGAERAATLTHRLLAFSRQQPLAPQPMDVNRFVGGMSDLLRRSLGEHVQLETVLAGGIWRTHADPAQLENAILNLAVNARDAMPDGGRLTIETANCHLDETYAAHNGDVPPGQYVLIAVSDTGCGMAIEARARAFDPFYTTKPVGQGTGLGLSQVHGFVKQSGGHVKIYSEIGQGTTVKLYLPRFFGEAEAMQERDGRAVDLWLGNPSEIVLVVEDEERARQVTTESLRELGYTVLHADSAAAALRTLDAREDISLLFTDIVMPEMNGRKLADEATRRRPGLKVLYTTGYTRNAIIHNGIVDPDVQLISKPFTLEQLSRKVRDRLDRI